MRYKASLPFVIQRDEGFPIWSKNLLADQHLRITQNQANAPPSENMKANCGTISNRLSRMLSRANARRLSIAEAEEEQLAARLEEMRHALYVFRAILVEESVEQAAVDSGIKLRLIITACP